MLTASNDHRGVDLISDVLPFGRLWYGAPDNAVGYAMQHSRSHDAVIRVYDADGNVIETHENKGDLPRLIPLRSFGIRDTCRSAGSNAGPNAVLMVTLPP
jgi:hypothetical protein